LSVVALMAAASFGLTATILACGKGGALLPGLIDIGALAAAVAGIGPDDTGIESGRGFGCSLGSPLLCGLAGGTTYQHLR
jgi:hypothetical protein